MGKRIQKEAADDLCLAHSRMTEDEFSMYLLDMVVLGLGYIYASHGEEFYEGFLQHAKQSPFPVKFKKVAIQ